MTTRRDLLKSTTTILALRGLTLASPLAVVLSSRPANAWFIAAVQVVGAIAGLMSVFGARGDGGLGAMMTAVQQKLDLIVEQNNRIRQELANLQQAVNDLSDKIIEIFRSNWLMEKASAIDGVVKRFNLTMTTSQ